HCRSHGHGFCPLTDADHPGRPGWKCPNGVLRAAAQGMGRGLRRPAGISSVTSSARKVKQIFLGDFHDLLARSIMIVPMDWAKGVARWVREASDCAQSRKGEARMPRVIGPTIPRWRLSEKLRELREAAGLSIDDVAKELGCSTSKIKKLEAAVVGVDKAELEYMLRLYGVVDDTELRELLFDWQRQGKRRGWWVKLGALPRQYTTLLGLESSAMRIRTYEPMVIPGLMQTEDYAEAIESVPTAEHGNARAHIVQARMERQKTFWEGEDDPTRLWVVVDEAALW